MSDRDAKRNSGKSQTGHSHFTRSQAKVDKTVNLLHKIVAQNASMSPSTDSEQVETPNDTMGSNAPSNSTVNFMNIDRFNAVRGIGID